MDSRDISRSRDLAWQPSRRPLNVVTSRASTGAPAPGSVSLAQLIRGALRWWWQGLLVGIVISAGLCIAIQYLIKPTYETSSLLRVEPSSQQLFGNALGSDNSYLNFMETQVQLITSSNVLAAAVVGKHAIEIPAIRSAADPEMVLKEMIQVRILPKSYLINVSTTSRSATEAAAAVNAVVDSYLEADKQWSVGMTDKQIKSLEAYRNGVTTQVDEKQAKLLELAARGNAQANPANEGVAGTEASKTSISIEEYKRVRSQLLQAQLDLAEAEAVRDFRRLQAPALADAGRDVEAQIRAAFQQDPEVAGIQDEIDQYSVKLAKVNRIARRGGDPTAVGIERQIATLKSRQKRLWEQKYPMLKDLVTRPGAPASEPLKDISEQVVTLKATIATMEQALARMEVADREHSTDAVKAAKLQSDLKRLEEMGSMVDRRLEQLRFESKGHARISQIYSARVPTWPTSDKRPKLMATAPLGAFAFVFAMAMLLEIKAGRIGATADLSRRVGVEVFSVPPLPSDRQPRVSLARTRSYEDLVSDYVHSVDHLREALCGGLTHGGPGRCVLITSAVGGEGKSTLASQLAVRCGNAGASTLLIDCDLRRPSLGRLLDVPEGAGIVDVLRNTAELEDVLIHLDRFGCDFLPAGLPEANPARIILGQRLGPLLERLRRSYDVVIVDSPPVLPVPDALTLGRFVDGAVLATRYDASRMRLVERAHQTLLSAGIPILGVVVNGVHSGSHSGGDYAASYTAARPSAESI